MFVLKNLFSSAATPKAKLALTIGGYLLVAIMSLGVLYSVHKTVQTYYLQKKELKDYQTKIKELNEEIETLTESNKVSENTIQKLNKKLQVQYAQRVKEKKSLDKKIEEINNSKATPNEKTLSKTDAYYDDIYSMYCQLGTSQCSGGKE